MKKIEPIHNIKCPNCDSENCVLYPTIQVEACPDCGYRTPGK